MICHADPPQSAAGFSAALLTLCDRRT